ncbi:MAG: glycosyltransferase family 4 protein [Planctomycetota bacterium]|jgi:glycosyltransferase involved in cell wall biosynthesis
MGKTNVVHVITRLILGGAQENTLLTCEGLHERPGYRATLVTGPAIGPEGELFRYAESKGLRVVVIDAMRRAVHPWRDLVSFLKLFAFFRRERPDVVHTHSAKAGILGRMAARLAGVPHIVHTVHGLPFHANLSALENGLALWAEQFGALFCDRMVAVGEVMKRKAVAARLARDVDVVYSGMRVRDFLEAPPQREARRRLGIAEKAEVVTVVARLAPLKGHDHLIDAAARIRARRPDLTLVFVGDGTLRARLERRAAEAGVPVVFAGLVEPGRIPEYLAAADVIAHASFREGLPRVAPQALLAGRPVVAFDCDGAREVVLDGVTGRLVPPGDTARLAEALEGLLARPAERRAMGEEGRRRFAERFDARRMVDRLDGIYRALKGDA